MSSLLFDALPKLLSDFLSHKSNFNLYFSFSEKLIEKMHNLDEENMCTWQHEFLFFGRAREPKCCVFISEGTSICIYTFS